MNEQFIGQRAPLHLDWGLAHPQWALEREEVIARRENPTPNPLVITWRSPVPCFVHGRGRDPFREILGVPRGACLVERFTGGGTVYLDEGVLSVAVNLPARGLARKDVGVLYEGLLQMIVEALNRRVCCFERRNGNDVVFRGWKVMGTAGAIRRRTYHLHFTVLIKARLDEALKWYRPLEELLRLHPRRVDPVKHRPANLVDLEPGVAWSRLVLDSVFEAVNNPRLAML